MIVVEKHAGLGGKPRNLKKVIWIAAFVAGAGAAAGGLYNYQTGDKANGYTEPSSIYCPNPPCEIIIVNGNQRCVYINNHTKACP